MSDPVRRVQRWMKKYSAQRTKDTIDLIHEDMAQRYAAATADLAAMETKVRTVLNQSGVHTTHYIPYLNYARQLYKLSRKRNIAGNSFAIEAKVLLDKWVARDLRADVLATIRSEVFDIGEPPSP